MSGSPQYSHGYYWHVIRSHYGHELRAEVNLRAGGIETFLPWVRPTSRRRSKRDDREALFPQYLFARFEPVASFHDVAFARGVQEIVRVGGQLATVDDDLIEFFRSRVDEHGFVPLGRKLASGDHVRIRSGPFADLAGIVERNLPGRERVIVLLTGIGSPMRVEVSADHVRTSEVVTIESPM